MNESVPTAARQIRSLVYGLIVGGFALHIFGGHTSHAQKNSTPSAESISLLQTFAKEFVGITPGKGQFPASFKMGSEDGTAAEKPVHEVKLAKPFAMARYEVPQNLYAAVTGKNPSRWQGPRNSVEMISWKDAQQFCRLATQQMFAAKLIQPDEVIRLPTEAEWEYCCRAGTETKFSFGDTATKPGDLGKTASALDPYAWHTGNAAGNDPAVGSLKPNPWGLYDMHGYLWEFVEDGYRADYSSTPTDGSAAKSGAQRVMRGGSWKDHHRHLRSATRKPISEQARDDAVGFRCVKSKKRGNK